MIVATHALAFTRVADAAFLSELKQLLFRVTLATGANVDTATAVDVAIDVHVVVIREARMLQRRLLSLLDIGAKIAISGLWSF